jgi:hypothetical protein
MSQIEVRSKAVEILRYFPEAESEDITYHSVDFDDELELGPEIICIAIFARKKLYLWRLLYLSDSRILFDDDSAQRD